MAWRHTDTQTRIIIYPKGKLGLEIEALLRFVGYNNIGFIDDNDKIKNIQNYQYSNNEKILISSRRNFMTLAKKLKDKNIPFSCGCEFVAECLNNYFSQRYNKNNLIACIIAGRSGSKHRGNVENFLKQMGIEIVFLCTNQKEKDDAQDRIGNSVALIIEDKEILSRINFFRIAISESQERFHPSVTSVQLSHSFSSGTDLIIQKNFSGNIRSIFDNNDYVIISSQRQLQAYKTMINDVYAKFDPPYYKLLPLGAPTLDRYNDIKIDKYTNDTILLAPNSKYCNYKSINKLIEELIKEYKIIYRPHPNQREDSINIKIVKQYTKYKNFTYDNSIKLSLEQIQKTPILITNLSSLSYTYTIATKSPCIIYSQKKVNPEEKIQMVANTIEEVKHNISTIINNREKFKNEITNYIKNEVFNFGDSSQKIAEFLSYMLWCKSC